MASVIWEVEPLRVELRTPFGTAHSSTTTRTNALVRCVLAFHDDEDAGRPRRAVVGIAEVGLPPKKPGVYDAEYADVERLVSEGVGPSGGTPTSPISRRGASLTRDAPSERTPRQRVRARAPRRARLHRRLRPRPRTEPPGRPCGPRGRSPGRLGEATRRLPPRAPRIQSSPSPSPSRPVPGPARRDVVPSYYTVAATPDDDLDALLANARWGRRRTPFIKLKVRANLEETAAALDAVVGLARENGVEADARAGAGDADTTPTGSTTSQTPPRPSPRRRWIALDANASWTAATTEDALAALSAHLPSVAVLEQPYPWI